MRDMSKKLVASLVLVPLLAGSWLVSTGHAQPMAEEATTQVRTVSVNGTAEVFAEPDVAVLTFGVVSADADLAAAVADNDQRGRTLLAALKQAGAEEGEVSTTQMDVSPQYDRGDRDSVRPLTIVGYRVTRQYTVRVNSLEKVPQMIRDGLGNGANQLDGPNYGVVDSREKLDEARDLAADAAREKATRLADRLDCDLGPVRKIVEAGGYGPMVNNRLSEGATIAVGRDAMPAGREKLSATLSVTFDLLPR